MLQDPPTHALAWFFLSCSFDPKPLDVVWHKPGEKTKACVQKCLGQSLKAELLAK